MIWASWSDFFAMGGYALYIWGSVIVTAICLFGEIIGLKLRSKALIAGAKPGRKTLARQRPTSTSQGKDA